MKLMRRFESFLETGIEGFFNRKLASQLQPAELLLALVKRLEEEQTQGFLLEEIHIQVSQEDYEQLQKPQKSMPEGVMAWLSRRLLEEAVDRSLEVECDMPIFLDPVEVLASGMFKVVVQKVPKAETQEEEGCTRVFQALSGSHCCRLENALRFLLLYAFMRALAQASGFSALTAASIWGGGSKMKSRWKIAMPAGCTPMSSGKIIVIFFMMRKVLMAPLLMAIAL